MEYITTTQFRTKIKWLLSMLKQGKSVYWIHRSKVIGMIVPVSENNK